MQQSAAPPAGVEPSTVAAIQNVLVGVEKPPVQSENHHGAQLGGKVDLAKAVTQATSSKLSRETLRRLRLGDTGEISYCKIKDYVTLKESEASEDETVQMRDGWKLVNEKATPKIKLENNYYGAQVHGGQLSDTVQIDPWRLHLFTRADRQLCCILFHGHQSGQGKRLEKCCPI